MRISNRTFLAFGALASLAACSHINVANRARPNEFAVQREAPLVVPPDFELVPPQPGTPRPTQGTAAQQAMQALFGSDTKQSAGEVSLLEQAGTDQIGIRSMVGYPKTHVVDKGEATRTILAAPQGDGQDARVAVPG